MRELFRGYYRPTDGEFRVLWEQCMFVFDTNVLLNLYRHSDEARSSLIGLLQNLSELDRVWLPYHVAYEYQQRRLGVIEQQAKLYSGLQHDLTALSRDFETHFGSTWQPFLDGDLLEQLRQAVSRMNEDLSLRQHAVSSLLDDDQVRDAITPLFAERVGSPPTAEELAEMHRQGEERFRKRIPPGYKDARKARKSRRDDADEDGDEADLVGGSGNREPGGEEQYGDVVLWLQIVAKAEAEKRPVVLVTDDGKEDWWWRRGRRTFGPRPELVDEMAARAGQAFYMYSTARFMEFSNEHLHLELGESDIAEVRALGEADALGYEVPSAEERDAQAASSTEAKATFPPTLAETAYLDEMARQAEAAGRAIECMFMGPSLRAYADATRRLQEQVYGSPAFLAHIEESVARAQRQILESPALRAQQELIRKIADNPQYQRLFDSTAFRQIEQVQRQYQRLVNSGAWAHLQRLQQSGAFGTETGSLVEPDDEEPGDGPDGEHGPADDPEDKPDEGGREDDGPPGPEAVPA